MSQACDPVATSLLYKDGILALPARTLDNPVDEVLFNQVEADQRQHRPEEEGRDVRRDRDRYSDDETLDTDYH